MPFDEGAWSSSSCMSPKYFSKIFSTLTSGTHRIPFLLRSSCGYDPVYRTGIGPALITSRILVISPATFRQWPCWTSQVFWETISLIVGPALELTLAVLLTVRDQMWVLELITHNGPRTSVLEIFWFRAYQNVLRSGTTRKISAMNPPSIRRIWYMLTSREHRTKIQVVDCLHCRDRHLMTWAPP